MFYSCFLENITLHNTHTQGNNSLLLLSYGLLCYLPYGEGSCHCHLRFASGKRFYKANILQNFYRTKYFTAISNLVCWILFASLCQNFIQYDSLKQSFSKCGPQTIRVPRGMARGSARLFSPSYYKFCDRLCGLVI